MATLNLRGIEKELIAQLKSEAALAGISLRDYCADIFKSRDVHGIRIPSSSKKIRSEKSDPKKETAVEQKERKPLCKIDGHAGFWRTDGYWCAGCGKLY